MNYKYRQASDFWYLTGFSEPNSAVILGASLPCYPYPALMRAPVSEKDHSSRGYKMTLFCSGRDLAKEKWDGANTSIDDAKAIFQADDALSIHSFNTRVKSLAPTASHVYVDIPGSSSSRKPKSLLKYLTSTLGAEGEEALDGILASVRRPLAPQVGKLRAVKSKAEQRVMRQAADISGRAHAKTMRFTQPGQSEGALAAHFEYLCALRGSPRPAYVPVVASGSMWNRPNSLILHYTNNNHIIQDGELVLIDAGCEYNGYASDITRTYPANGTFSPAQRDLYSAVLSAQKELIKLCSASQGFSLQELHRKSCVLLKQELNQIGFNLGKGTEGDLERVLYPHYLSHPIGVGEFNFGLLDADSADVQRGEDVLMMEGMVITIEPGIYVPPTANFPKHFHNIGIRIEDEVLVGEEDPTVLSVSAPKEEESVIFHEHPETIAVTSDYGPVQVGPDEVAACKQFLLCEKLVNPDSDGYRWEYDFNDPGAVNGGEVKDLTNIKIIVDAIFKYAATTSRGRGNKYSCELLPDTHLKDDTAGANHSMDASIVEPGYTGGQLASHFSIVPIKCRTNRTPYDQRKITIEGTQMAMWYFSRTHCIKALSFNWVEEGIDMFIHIFLAFAFATRKELGIDPLVHKALANPEDTVQHYIYECPIAMVPLTNDAAPQPPQSKYFKTVHSIHDQSPKSILGRSTRIWKVIEVDSLELAKPISTEPVVLKDVWLETGTATEADNLDSIFEAIEKLISDSKDAWGDSWLPRLMSDDKRFASFDQTTKAQLQRLLGDGNYKTLFLTKLYTWKGEVSKPLSSTACNSARGGNESPSEAIHLSTGSVLTFILACPLPTTTLEDISEDEQDELIVKWRKIKRRYASKEQSRFVYKEVCAQLFEVENLGAFMDLVLQTTEVNPVQALLILFCAGWVHRDISSGNLLAFNNNGSWKIKLSDLEFSEQFSHERRRADATPGTPFFMPHEIITRKHLVNWIRDETDPEFGLAKQVNILGDKTTPLYRRLSVFQQIQWGERVNTVPDNVTSNIPDRYETVRYNFQHDLEALWWIVVYFITACVPHRASRNRAKLLFPKSLTVYGRRSESFLNTLSVELGDHLHPTIADAFTIPMERLRNYLLEQYVAREVFGQIDVHESYSMIHKDFATNFRELLENEEDGWKQVPIVPSHALTGVISPVIGILKRGQDDNDAPAGFDKKARNDAN
ncbi:hypothetical protein D9619_001139 [Psilocybe cf. subviscida]|uniref:Aminopeptidase P N-terminal domain-containing protein n=1 Tax=Psilocybe cf. subviscida TaxID=2480587 RepID=A0A8H5BHP5_9AGAR|nr:hypothetical protein D9619_001139 [Psilocybe cf. subviscida]